MPSGREPLPVMPRASVPCPAQGVNELGVVAVVDLAAQTAHEHLEDVGERIVILVPDMRGDRGAIHDLVAMTHETFEKRKFLRGQLDVPSGAPDTMAAQVHLEVGDGRDLRQQCRTAARERVKPRDQFTEMRMAWSDSRRRPSRAP